MSALIDYIQKEIHNTYNKKYSKKYIKDKLVPIINYICSSKSKKFLFGGSQGIGGIFFDYKKGNWEKDFAFVRDVGLSFNKIFNETIKKKRKKKWTRKQKEIQYLKRGRYVEFNLLYDRGTKFGLQTGGNVEGILMSLPPIAKWK